jgi:hypothetical protein
MPPQTNCLARCVRAQGPAEPNCRATEGVLFTVSAVGPSHQVVGAERSSATAKAAQLRCAPAPTGPCPGKTADLEKQRSRYLFESTPYLWTSSIGKLMVWSELPPTITSYSPGMTLKCMLMSHCAKSLGLSINVTVRVWPG